MGSTSYITNLDGDVVQHIEYVPFGEVFLEERNNKWNTPYLFNAKELDEETGLYYYGARYYDSRSSVWLSVDPLAIYNPFEIENFIDGKHNDGIYNSFNHAVYGYCYQNPVLYIDPNGKQSKYSSKELTTAVIYPKESMMMRFESGSNTIGTVATRYAMTGASPESSSIFSSEVVGRSTGGINAMRHVLLSVLSYGSLADDAVSAILSSHEKQNTLDMSKREFDTYDDVDFAADMHNNDVGKQIGEGISGWFKSQKTILEEVANYAKNEGIWVGEKKGNKFILKQVKISEQKYKDFINAINKQDRNGIWIKENPND